jgi:hypothetical protein
MCAMMQKFRIRAGSVKVVSAKLVMRAPVFCRPGRPVVLQNRASPPGY